MQTESPKPESFRPLISRGNMEALSDWIRARRPLRETSKNGKRVMNALELAVDTGFYSMVKLLLDKEIWSDDEMDHALDTALWSHREDLVGLLIDKGATVTRISFYAVFRTMNNALIDRFLDIGLDPCQDNAFAKILDETKAKPLLRFFKDKRTRFPALDDQMAMALIQAIQRKNVRWSALLLWAGADLRREAPYDLHSDPADENSYKTTALQEALSARDLKFMEALKIKPEPGMLGEMLQHASYGRDRPVFVKHLVPSALLPLNPNTKARFSFKDVCKAVTLPGNGVRLAVIDGELHPTGNIHADSIRDHGVLRCEHATDRQAVADVGVGHQRARHRDRQRTGVGHLPYGVGFETLAPLTPRREFRTRRERRFDQRTSKLADIGVRKKRRWIGHNPCKLSLHLLAVHAAGKKPLHVGIGKLLRVASRHAQADQVIGVHNRGFFGSSPIGLPRKDTPRAR